MIQHKIVLGVIGAIFGSLTLLTIGEWIQPSKVIAKAVAGPVMTPAQQRLLAMIAKYQGQYAANKLVIGREGTLTFDGQPDKGKNVNLVVELYGMNDPMEQKNFTDLMESVPPEYLRFFPEMRWDSPFVVSVTDRGTDYLRGEGK